MHYKVMKVQVDNDDLVNDDGVRITLESFLNKCSRRDGKLVSLNVVSPNEYLIVFDGAL